MSSIGREHQPNPESIWVGRSGTKKYGRSSNIATRYDGDVFSIECVIVILYYLDVINSNQYMSIGFDEMKTFKRKVRKKHHE